MAAPGGLNLPVGIELSQVEKDLQKLTSSVENVSDQLSKRLELKPTINTKAYEAAVDKMNDALMKLQTNFSKGFSYKVDNGKGFVDASFDSDSLFGSIDKMKASVAQLKGMLRNPGKYELNVGDAKKLIGLQELIIKNWQTSTNEIHKQDAAVKSLISKEVKLRNETKQRINDSISRHERDRADAKNLNRRTDQIRAERVAIGKLISDYEQLAAKQRKFGESDAGTMNRIAKLRAEHTQYKNLEREELNRQKAINQNNALFNDQRKVFEKLWTAASRYISIFTLWNFGQKIIETTGYFQQQQVALEGILGSASKAEKAIQRIRNMALNSPKTTYELVGYTKQLAAYDVGDQDPDKLLDVVHQLAELSTGLGVDMQRLILAYGQVNAASVLRGQELRQFTEAGIPMVQALADKFTQLNGHLVTTGEVFELISKRQVSFEMVASVLRDMTAEGGKFNEMQSRVTDTLYGQMQKLKDLWTINLDNLGKSTGGLLGNIVSALQGIVKNIRPIANSLLTFSLLKTAAKWFSAIVILSGSLNRNLAHAQWQMRNFYRSVRAASGAMATMKAIARGITSGGVVGAAFNAAFLALSAVVGLIVKARQKTKEWHRTLNDINVSFAKDTYALTSGVDKLIGKLHNAAATSKDYKEILDTLKSNYGEYLNDGIIQQLELEAKNAEATAHSWGKLSDAIKEAIIAKKEYERHDTRRSTAIDNIMKDLDGEMKSTIRRAVKDNSSGEFVASNKNGVKQIEYKTTYNEVAKELRKKDANGAIMSAVREFLDRGFINASDLQPLLESQMLRYGFSMKTASDIGGRYENIFNKIKNAQGYDVYSEETGYINTSLQNMLNNVFDAATDSISKNYKNYTGVRDGNGSYNPFGIQEFQNKSYIGALRQVFESKDFQRYIPKEVTDALKKDKDFLSAIRMSDADEGKTKALSDAITSFVKSADGITPQVAKNIHQVVSDFIRLAGTNSVDAARVRTHMGQYMHFGNLSDDEKDFINRFKPTDQNIESMISSIAAEYQEMHDFNEKLRSTDPNATFNEKYKRNERLMSLLDILALPEYYNQGSWLKKSGSGRTPREFPEWVNIFKDAYDLYKKATTEGGTERGVAKVLSDKTIQELYGDFFKNPGSVKEFGFKIGNKTISEIIQENLIEGGLEDGIVDFRKAATATAQEMIEYGKANEKERGHFVRAGQQLLKWVSDTFADDSVKKWLDELSKSLQDLTMDFNARKTDIELYRQLINNGTASQLGIQVPTVTDDRDAIRPDSSKIRSYIMQIVNDYNSSLRSLSNESGIEYTPFDIGDIRSLSGISEALKRLTDPEEMNNQAFTVMGKEGKLVVERLTKALGDLDKTVRDEMKKLSGMSATGNRLNDVLANARIKSGISQLNNEAVQAIANALNVSPDQVAAAARVDTAKSSADDILKAFLDSNNYDTLFSAFRKPIDFTKLETKLDELINALPDVEKLEIQRRYAEMEGNAKVFNASRGDFAPFFSGLDDYRTAGSRAEVIWNNYATDEKASKYGSRFDANTNAWSLEGVTDPEALAYLNELNRALDEVGKNGIKLSAVFKKQALDSIKNFATTSKNTLNAMSDVVKNLVSSVQAFIKAFNKAYDVMNDGENPKWMQDTEAFLGDFAENFEAMIAPMSAVIALIVAITVAITVCEAVATPLLIVMAAVVAAAAILAAIMAAFQQHDRKLEHSIEGLKENVEAFDNAITNLQAAAERGVGFEKLRKNIEATGKELEKATAYAEMARLEEEKKNTDDDKVKEYKQSYQEAIDSFLNSMREVRNELVSSTEDWANAMGSAIRSAFQNGENAARAFRDTVKTMIGDVIENMLEMAILQPLIESALENWTNSDYLRQKYTKEWTEKDENGKEIKRSKLERDGYMNELLERIGNPELAEEFYQSMLMIGDTLIDTVNGMHPFLKDAYMHNSELGTLSGGIESVTEDTARRIEALENSQLGEVFAIRMMLQNYLEGSGFGDSMTADLQAAIVSIASDTNLIRIATESILARIDQMRTSNVQPLHVTIV